MLASDLPKLLGRPDSIWIVLDRQRPRIPGDTGVIYIRERWHMTYEPSYRRRACTDNFDYICVSFAPASWPCPYIFQLHDVFLSSKYSLLVVPAYVKE